MLKNERGITLVALVITIIVLIILATVSISLALGNGGIISGAEEAANMTAKDSADVLNKLWVMEDKVNDIVVAHPMS